MKEQDATELFNNFMERRGIRNTTEFIDYVTYLEDVKSDYHALKNRVASLYRLTQEMY